MLNLKTKLVLDKETILAPNLTTKFDDEDLSKIGALVWEGYDRDERSRSAWKRRNEAGMDLALQVMKAKNFPWPNCSNVAFPLITIAALQFHARAYPAIISGPDIAKCRAIGDDTTGQATDRASRIQTHMSWQCLEEDVAWEEQHDRLLINLGIVGCNFIKTYNEGTSGVNVSELVLAKDFVVDYFAKSTEAAARKTQVIPLPRNEIYSKAKRGIFADVLEETWYTGVPQTQDRHSRSDTDHRQGVTPSQPDENTPFRGLEQHVLLDLDQDGYAEPYIITIEETTKTVLRIVCGFDREEDIERANDGSVISITQIQYYTKYSFIPSPDGGFYDVGFGVLLGPLNESTNSIINQLVDAGTVNNLSGGFLGRGAKIRGGVYTFSPFGWQRIDSNGDDIRKDVMPYPVREPSAVLFQLLGLLIDYTNRISGANDMMVGENPGQNTPAETARTLVQEGQRIYSAIFKRVWRAMKEELKKRFVLNAIYMPDKVTFAPGSFVLREDYLSNPDAVAPAADPNVTSDSQVLAQYQMVKASAATTPGYDIEALEKIFLKRLKIPDAEIIYPGLEAFPPGKSEKITIQEMKTQVEMMKLQASQQTEMARLQMEQEKMQAEIMKLQAEIMLKQAELEGDVEDREIQRMNGMLSMLKERSAADKSRMDTLMKQMDVVMRQIDASVAASEAELARAEAEKTRRDESREDRKLDQADRKLDIEEKKANKPAGAAK